MTHLAPTLQTPSTRAATGAVAFTAALLFTSAFARGQAFDLLPEKQALDGSLATNATSIQRSAAAQLTPDLRNDLVTLSDGKLIVHFALGTMDAAARLPVDVTDFAVLPGGAPNGCDALVTVDAVGLTRWWIDVPSQAFVSAPLGGTAWAGVTRVRTADIDANGEIDIVGLHSNQQTLLRLFSPLGASSETPISPGGTIYDFQPLDWISTAQLECALLTNVGVRIVRNTGIEVDFFEFGAEGDTLVVQRLAGASHDRLACFTTANGSDALFLATNSGEELPIDLGALDVAGAESCDLNGDGKPELVISHRSARTLVVLCHAASGTPTYSMTSSYTLQYGAAGAPLGNDTNPAVADFDEDSDFDIALPSLDRRGTFLWKNRLVLASSRQIGVLPKSYVWDYLTNIGTLSLELSAPAVSVFTPTHIEITVWKHDSEFEKASAEAISHLYAPVNWASGPQDQNVYVHDRLGVDPMYSIEYRPVIFDAPTSRVTTVGPTTKGAKVYTDMAVDAIEQYFLCSVLEQYDSLDEIYPPEPPMHGNILKGSNILVAYLELGDLPDFEEDEIPFAHDDQPAPYGEW